MVSMEQCIAYLTNLQHDYAFVRKNILFFGRKADALQSVHPLCDVVRNSFVSHDYIVWEPVEKGTCEPTGERGVGIAHKRGVFLKL